MPSLTRRTIVLIALAVTAACGSDPGARLAAVAPSGPMPPLPPGAPGAGEWLTWSREQKVAYMKSGFLAAEQQLFDTWEPERYRNLSCRDCHGSGVDDGSFRMPNPELPKLGFRTEGFKELAAHEPEVFRFMQRRVVPETARLLGLPAFGFEAHTGFSCFQCHLRKEDGR